MQIATLSDTSVAAFGAAASTLGGDSKPICKFDKGDWVIGQDKELVPTGARFALNMGEAQWGWLLWRDKKVDDRRMAAVASGTPIPSRGELGHTDQAMWDRDKDGKAIDPWSKTIELPARELSGEQREINMSGSSKGWEGCCKTLFKAFSDGMKLNTGKVPVVELGVGRYNHSTYGTVKVPVLTIVDWKTPAELMSAEPAPKAKQSKF